ncbi:MAG: T9SS type A sorting domain-containing protein, partial [Bacteroidetes bacterium]|nr:T9SS type A sorting domain-containing protein [Bacteroidota bacterium]
KIQFDNPISNYTGSGTLAYSWLPKTGLDSATLARPIAEIITPATYVLEVTSPKGCKATDSIKIIVNPLLITANGANVICGNSAQLSVSTNYSGSGTLTYEWSPKTGLNDSSIANPVATVNSISDYTVEVTTPNGCNAHDNATVNTTIINFTPSICMVTVNENDKNEIVWEKGVDAAIDSFYIYKESSIQTGQYNLIGEISHSQDYLYTDTSSNARVQSNKYKIATKDMCGFSTSMSDEHKTMHLTINKGSGNNWNLIWEQYFGETVSSYLIYRGTTKNNLTMLANASSSNTTYTDETAPAGDVYYQIEAIFSKTCSDYRDYESSRSNIKSIKETGNSIQENSATAIFIYPNPARNLMFIKTKNSLNSSISIRDIQGKEVLNQSISTYQQIDISMLSEGMYTVMLICPESTMMNKLVVEK